MYYWALHNMILKLICGLLVVYLQVLLCAKFIIEMSSGKPVFKGTTAEDQLLQIFKKLGTPNASIYPNIVNLPDYDPDFPRYKRKNLSYVTGLYGNAVPLLEVLLFILLILAVHSL